MVLLRDLKKLDPLLAPLATPRYVTQVSDIDLLETVESEKPEKYREGSKSMAAPIQSANGARLMVPGEVLMELARASAPAGVGRRLHTLGLQWAWIRYCWAFEKGEPYDELSLSPYALKQTRHLKAATSEQLGIGLAITAARNLFQRRHPGCTIRFHDADSIIDGRPPATWGLGETKGTRPDYIIQVLAPRPKKKERPSALYALECKGTFSAGHHVTQIRRGLQQVLAVKKTSGRPLSGVVCASSFLAGSPVTLYLLDPDDGVDFVAPDEPGEPGPAFVDDNEGTRIQDEGALRRELDRLNRASSLSFAGLYREAEEVLPDGFIRRMNQFGETEEDQERMPAGQIKNQTRPGDVIGRATQGVVANFPLMDGRQIAVATEVDAAVLRAAEDLDEDFEGVRDEFATALARSEIGIPGRLETRARFGEHELPASEEWGTNVEIRGRNHLRLVSPSGEMLDFRLG